MSLLVSWSVWPAMTDQSRGVKTTSTVKLEIISQIKCSFIWSHKKAFTLLFFNICRRTPHHLWTHFHLEIVAVTLQNLILTQGHMLRWQCKKHCRNLANSLPNFQMINDQKQAGTLCGPLAMFSFYSLWYSFLRTEDKICVVIKTNEITTFMM